MADPWLTIITVVKDDTLGFARTAGTVMEQDLTGVEWVVIDSSADTSEIPAVIASLGVTPHYEWATPSGVYPAMNTGLALARGDYVYFLNAGDCFHDTEVLAHLKSVVLRDRPQWLYGQVCFVSPSGDRVTPRPFDYDAERSTSFSRGRFPPHQGTIATTSLLRKAGGFDESFRIAADYAAFLRLTLLGPPAETSRVIADFYEGGVSTTHWRESLREFHRARRQILEPTGVAALRERAETARQWTTMSLARLLGR